MNLRDFVRPVAVASGIAVVLFSAIIASADVEAGWKGSLYVQDDDAGYKIKVGGRIMIDWIWTDVDSIPNGTLFRRARLYTSGDIYHNVFYKIQLDFAGGDADFKDVFIGVKKIPLVSAILVGHQYEPAGLETITSSKVITFMERASVSTLMPERHTGFAMARQWPEDKFTLSIGGFQNSDNYGNARGDDYAVTGRFTFAPTNVDKGKKLLHFGVSGSYRESPSGVFEQKARPENPFAPQITSGVIFANTLALFGGEFIGNWGPISVQSEAAFLSVESDSIGTPMISSWYVQGSYFITGEHRGYKYGKGAGITPEKNFDGTGGAGAWEVAARYSTLDMNDDQLQAGEFNIATAGVNWYLNPYTRVMLNYSYTDYTSVGKLHMIAMRFQISF